MNESDFETEVEFMGDDVVVVGDEAYKLSEDEVKFHTNSEGTFAVVKDDVYLLEFDEDGWLVADEDLPEVVLEDVDERFADAEAYGFPVEVDVSFRADDAMFNTMWQEEVLRPSMDVMDDVKGSIKSVTLTVEVDEDGGVTVVDMDLWPNSSATIDLD